MAIVHPTAEVSPSAIIGDNTHIWHHAQVREGAIIGNCCIIGKGVYIDVNVQIGNNVKIQNYALLYRGAIIRDGVFIGPAVSLANDKVPRAITSDGRLKGIDDWEANQTVVCYGASIGAGVILLPGVIIGRFAMIGAGALVTEDVPDLGLIIGHPGRLVGYVCQCGQRLTESFLCTACHKQYSLEGHRYSDKG